MKLLFDNLIQTATITSVYASDATDVNYIKDRLLELKYLSSETTDTITAEWDSDQTISCIALGYHNLSSASYTLKNSVGTTIGSGSLEVTYDTNMTYFTVVSGVRSMEIDITSSDDAYVGGVGCGVPFSVDYHSVNPRFDYNNSGGATWLGGGQTYGESSTILDQWRATIDVENSNRLEYREGLGKVGNWFPIYADLYEDAHSEQRPIHAIMQGDGQFSRDSASRLYSTIVVAKEAR